MAPSARGLQEIVGTASSSGIFTQQGGINNPYTNDGNGDSGSFPALQLGVSNGGYGEYDMSGGSLGVNGIFVGGSDMNLSTSGIAARACSRKPAVPSADCPTGRKRSRPLV